MFSSLLLLLLLPLDVSVAGQDSQHNLITNTQFPVASENKRQYLSDITRLYADLLKDYEKNLSPAYAGSKAITIPSTALLASNTERMILPPKIVNATVSGLYNPKIDDTEQMLALNIIVDLEWIDERLSWDPSSYSDVRSMDVRREEIWMPDISPYNCISVRENRPKSQQSVRVTYQGIAWYRWDLQIKCLCSLKLEDYPFDSQNCELGLYNYQHDPRHLLLNGDLTEYSGWLLDGDAWSFRNVSSYNFIYTTNETGDRFSATVFSIDFDRYYGFYITFFVFPTTVLTAISLLAMFHEGIDDSNRLEKVGIGIASLSALTLILQMMAEEVPKKMTMSIIAKFILANLCTLAIAILVAIVNPIGLLYQQLSKYREQSVKIGPTSLATDSLTRRSGDTTRKWQFKHMETCLRNDKITLIVFEAAVFLYFGLIASFWST